MKSFHTIFSLLAIFTCSVCAQLEFGELQWDDTQVASSFIPHSHVASGYVRGSSSTQEFILVRNMTIKFDKFGRTGAREFPFTAYRISPKPVTFVCLTNEVLSNIRQHLPNLTLECEDLSPETYLKYITEHLPETDAVQKEWQNLPKKNQADNWCALGHLYLENGQPENALSCFKQSEILAFRDPDWELDDYRIPWAMREMAFGYARMLNTEQRDHWLGLHTDFIANLQSTQRALVERALLTKFEDAVSPPLSVEQFAATGIPENSQVFAGVGLQREMAVTITLHPNKTGEFTLHSIKAQGVLAKYASFKIVGTITPDFEQDSLSKPLKQRYPFIEKSVCWELQPFGLLFYPLPANADKLSAMFLTVNNVGVMFLPFTDIRELKSNSNK